MELLKRKIKDEDILGLLQEVIGSFCTCCMDSRFRGNDSGCKGIPLGNLTSQIFANIYMSELDQFIKHQLKVKYYIRYADDFLTLSSRFNDLNHLIELIEIFLRDKLKLLLHPKKIIFRRFEWGIDFLGYIDLPNYQLPGTKTKKRIFKKLRVKIDSENFHQSLQSYLGYLSHANSFKVTQSLKEYLYLLPSRQ